MKRFITLFGVLSALFSLQFIGGGFEAFGQVIEETSKEMTPLDGLSQFWVNTGFHNMQLTNIIMIGVGLFFIFLAIKYDYEPLLLVPIGTGILIGNVPFVEGNLIGIYE